MCLPGSSICVNIVISADFWDRYCVHSKYLIECKLSKHNYYGIQIKLTED